MPTEYSLDLKNIFKSYVNQPIISNFSLKIKSGSFVSILGPSGCGKSTLLNIIAGIEKVDKGQMLLQNKPQAGPRIMFQDYSLFPWHNCVDNVLLGMAQLPGTKLEKTAKAVAWLQAVGLEKHKDKYPKELSGGMKQRVALAQVLASESSIILMDEPFGSLDSFIREDLQRLILNIWKKHKKTILFVTHNISEALFVGSHILVLDDQFSILLNRPIRLEKKKNNDNLFAAEKEVRALLNK